MGILTRRLAQASKINEKQRQHWAIGGRFGCETSKNQCTSGMLFSQHVKFTTKCDGCCNSSLFFDHLL
jgi:uncharacterized protein (DUF983 family)